MPISAFAPKSGHTFCYIRLSVPIDIPRDTPTFSIPFDWHTNNDTPWDIPSFLLPFDLPTTRSTSQDTPTFSPSLICHTNNDIRWDTPTFSSTTKRDTFDYIQLVCHRFINSNWYFYITFNSAVLLDTSLDIIQPQPKRRMTGYEVSHRFCVS